MKEKFEKNHLEYQIYKGVGHGINHEIAKEINQKIIEYFKAEDTNTNN